MGSPAVPEPVTAEERYLEQYFPGLQGSSYEITSPPDRMYNCVAWAVGATDTSWNPLDDNHYWPPGLPRRNTIEVVLAALSTAGYAPCGDDTLEDSIEKIAIYGVNAEFRHVARQLPTGRWTSKLGLSFDIEHELEALTSSANVGGGVQYGEVAAYMSRPRAG